MITIDQNVMLAAAGDDHAFQELYMTYHDRVFGLCFRMTRSWSKAEDLTQEVFVQVLRKLKSFRGEAQFGTWLHQVALNQVRMHFRKPVVSAEQTTDDGTLPLGIEPGTENPAHMSIIDRISLEEAIKLLSPGYRTVFILHDVEGYEHEQISRMLGCAVGTSKSQLHKARLKLRRLLMKKKSPQQQRLPHPAIA